MRRSCVLLASLPLFCAGAAQSAEVPYTGAEGRDPFAPVFERRKIAQDPDAEEKSLRSLVVQGIVSSSANPRAIVNGKIYKVGSSVMPGVKISRIEKQGVFVIFGEKELLLSRPTQPTKGKGAQ